MSRSRYVSHCLSLSIKEYDNTKGFSSQWAASQVWFKALTEFVWDQVGLALSLLYCPISTLRSMPATTNTNLWLKHLVNVHCLSNWAAAYAMTLLEEQDLIARTFVPYHSNVSFVLKSSQSSQQTTASSQPVHWKYIMEWALPEIVLCERVERTSNIATCTAASKDTWMN